MFLVLISGATGESSPHFSPRVQKGRGLRDERDAPSTTLRREAQGLIGRSVRQRSCCLTVWRDAASPVGQNRRGRPCGQHGTPEPNIALFHAARPHAAGQLDLVSAYPRSTRGCPPLDHRASLDREIVTMDKAWTTPPTAVPRADVGCDAKSSQGRNAPTPVRKHRPIQRASLPGRLQANIALFMHRGWGGPAQVLAGWTRSAEPACPPRLKWAMFCSLEPRVVVAAFHKYC